MKKYQIQEHIEKTTEYFVYELAPNGEVCRRVCVCRDKQDAEEVFRLLSEKQD